MSDKKDLFSYLELYEEGSPLIPLSMGAPGPETIKGCGDLISRATNIVLENKAEEQYTFQYGPSNGDPGFREELAKFLTQQYGDKVSSDDVMVTAGATQGLHFIATVMFDKSTPVFLEDPTYFIALKMLKEDFGMNTIPVPTDYEGINLDVLEDQLKKHRPKTLDGLKTPFWGLIYTIPTYNNPKGYIMSPERCRGLIRLARQYDVMVVAEDVYNMLTYTDQPYSPPRLLTYDDKSDPDFKGNVLSNCTFSKILAPGLRLGWIEAPPRIMSCLLKSKTVWSGGAFNHYTSKLMAAAMREGLLSEHVAWLKDNYKNRMKLACDELTKNLPSTITFTKPEGGFFIWLELPECINTKELLLLAIEKYQTNFIYGESTSPTGGSTNCVRLSISFCNLDKISLGVQRFCAALKEMLHDKSK